MVTKVKRTLEGGGKPLKKYQVFPEIDFQEFEKILFSHKIENI